MLHPPAATRLLDLLTAAGVPFERLAHDAARTADEAAALRGTPLTLGTKCLVMKLDGSHGFAAVALSAADRLANPLLRRHLGVRRYRFATLDELDRLTGLTPGAVPPFGRPVFDLPLFVDEAVVQRPRMAFSAARHDLSIVMDTHDWLALARPEAILPLAEATPGQAGPSGD